MKEETNNLLEKASRAIKAAQTLLQSGDLDFAAGRAYYAMFYIAAALLHEKSLRFKRHRGVQSAFSQHFVKTGLLEAKFHRWLVNAFDARIEGDYGIEVSVKPEDVVRMLAQAREFLQAARRYLGLAS